MEIVFVSTLTEDEYEHLLSQPYSELRRTESGKEVIVCRGHKLSDSQFFWLAKELCYKPSSDTLWQVLGANGRDEGLYTGYFKKKKNGEKRRILAPTDDLKDVQKRVLKNVLTLYPASSLAYGYSGGNIFDAIKPHLEAGNISLFSTDIKDAFGSVRFPDIFEALYGLPMTTSYKKRRAKMGYLSWKVAFALSRIVTCGERLPQGAPTSPRLFDIVFKKVDQRLETLAENVGGVYTRFADNIYFSMRQDRFPDVVARSIIRTIHENKSDQYSRGLMDARRFSCHKTAIRTLGDEAIRVLGVNVAGGEIRPTRDFKRKIRLSIHRMNWLLINTPHDIENISKCWGVLQGQMSFAGQALLPSSLLEQYARTKRNLEGLLVNGELPTISDVSRTTGNR